MEEKIIKVKNCGECPLLSKVYGSKQGFYYQCDANKRIKKFDKDLLHDKCPLPPNNNKDDLTTTYMYAYQQAKYKYKPRWRKYPEEKPTPNLWVLVKTHGDFVVVSYLRDRNHPCYEDSESGVWDCNCIVTHWMPIPDLED